jgi:hypothetical protein
MDTRYFTADGARVMLTQDDLASLLADAIDEALAAGEAAVREYRGEGR